MGTGEAFGSLELGVDTRGEFEVPRVFGAGNCVLPLPTESESKVDTATFLGMRIRNVGADLRFELLVLQTDGGIVI